MSLSKLELIKLHPDAKIPDQKHPGDAGYDMYCVEDTLVPTNKPVVVPTGIAASIPKGYYLEVHPRSSWALRGTVTKIGIIDQGYRGELGPITQALTQDILVKKGERIAQLVIRKLHELDFVEVSAFKDTTERGENGFGSTK